MFFSYLGGQLWPGWYYGPAYTTFMLDVLRLDIGKDMELRARAYAATCESACYWWPHKEFVMVSERPAVIDPGKRAEWRWTDSKGQPRVWDPFRKDG